MARKGKGKGKGKEHEKYYWRANGGDKATAVDWCRQPILGARFRKGKTRFCKEWLGEVR